LSIEARKSLEIKALRGYDGNRARVAKWQTHYLEVVAGFTPWRFESSPAHKKATIILNGRLKNHFPRVSLLDIADAHMDWSEMELGKLLPRTEYWPKCVENRDAQEQRDHNHSKQYLFHFLLSL
jgi:hypothetical protein